MIEPLQNNAFSATSYHNSADHCKPEQAKSSNTGWCPLTLDNPEDYLQINLGTPAQITSISTWGRKDVEQWVTTYTVLFSIDGTTFSDYGDEFVGNNDQLTEVKHALSRPFMAQYLRFMPTTYNQWKSMRVEAYGIYLPDLRGII